jgi:hypothetical protein
MLDILEILEQKALINGQNQGYSADSEIFKLRGVWKSSYVLQLTPDESLFYLHYVLAQTVGLGCSYYDPTDEEPSLHESLLGKNIFNLPFQVRSLRIAALDAAYYSLNAKPTKSFTISGTNMEKAGQRSQIICEEVFSLLASRTPKWGKKARVSVVGVVGGFLKILTERSDLEVQAVDFSPTAIDKTIHGVQVEDGTKQGSHHKGDRTLELIANADVALVTGMTLANDTLGEIITVSQKHRTALVLFAETGANFASEYSELGINTVVSEPFPFYLSGYGSTQINVFRK